MKLTTQESNIISFLAARSADVAWEELAQFAKNPQAVKLKTIQKSISDLKLKYKKAGVPFPFGGKFNHMKALLTKSPTPLVEKEEKPSEQVLVQVKKTPSGNMIRVDSGVDNLFTAKAAQTDFTLDFNSKRVRTKLGHHMLNDNEWDMMKYLHANPGRVIPISELRDQVVYPQFGSKLPARWFDAIKRIIGNLRAQVPGLKDRIMTVRGTETSYLFQ